MTLRIAIAQIDPIVGGFESNLAKIKESYERACAGQARFLLTPELSICGYPPHDLVERPEMFERNEKALEDLALITRGKKCALGVGHIQRNPQPTGRAAQNAFSFIENGKRVFTQTKTLLPTYDVFDESRYFEPAQSIHVWDCDGIKIGVAICEDLWARDPALERNIYRSDPVDSYQALNVQVLLSASASPFILGKGARREKIHSEIAKLLKCPLVYVNQVGATDEILFDGGSFAVDHKGKQIGRLPFFEPSFAVIDIESSGGCQWISPQIHSKSQEEDLELEKLYQGLVLGIRCYFQRTGFSKAVLGLSGGIDSAVVGTLACHALGPKNVLGVAMPSQFSSSHSLEDAYQLAKNLGMHFEVKPIKFMNSVALREISEGRGTLASLAQENLQARLRGLILMTLSNHENALVLTTGNKSELATGYCTLYGDMVGALAPLGDLYKTKVYELARFINHKYGHELGALIPESSITKAPSAELRPNQTDQESLPPYDLLDQILEQYIEKRLPADQIQSQFGSLLENTQYMTRYGKNWVKDILRKVELNEYKRRQSAPVLKVSNKAFGIGRRVPLARSWD